MIPPFSIRYILPLFRLVHAMNNVLVCAYFNVRIRTTHEYKMGQQAVM